MTAAAKRVPPVEDFLNVDVEVTSSDAFKRLPAELEESCVILFNGRAHRGQLLCFESAESFSGRRFLTLTQLERTLRALCSTLENLSPAARREWNSARSRVFDIGFDASRREKRSHLAARVEVSEVFVRRIAALNAKVVFTVYRRSEK